MKPPISGGDRRPPSKLVLIPRNQVNTWPAVAITFILGVFLMAAIPTIGFAQDKPLVRTITVRKLTVGEGDSPKVTLAIDITGDRFGTSEIPIMVELINLDTGAAAPAKVTKHDASKIIATIELPTSKDPVKYEFRVKVNGESAISDAHLADFSVVIKKEEEPKPKASALQITYESFKSEEYPNLHSLLITNKSDNATQGFSSNPALMKVDIVPPGATNITVQPGSNPYQMLVTFLASEKFVPKGVMVTVFDPTSTMANSKPLFFSTPFKEKEKKPDANQPKIDEIAITSIQRHSGYGTLRITGSGFGDYERPPITGEKELLCILHRSRDPRIADEQEDRIPRKDDDDNLELSQFPARDKEVCNQVTDQKRTAMNNWRQRIEERVNVTLQPRNPDFRVERTQILYVDDKVINVYFEFTRFDGYSAPFRLENATVTVNKGAVVQSPVSDEGGKYTALLSGPQTFIVPKQIGAAKDANLEFTYTILNQRDAKYLFGSGVGENFYVIELAVVNNGKKKVAVPLGSIQADVAWLYGWGKNEEIFFEEGPPTIPPLPLGAVSGYFDAFQKTKGKAAKLFNVLEGIATLSTAMIPVIRELGGATNILSNGVIPGLRKSIGDLSSEQLARLTSMSWEGIEEIAAGGSKSKFIYIPRAEQLFGDFKRLGEGGVEYNARKKVINLTGLEVVGFEVTESEKKQATGSDDIHNGEIPKP